MEENNFETIERDIAKIRYNIDNTEMSMSNRLILLNILRYNLGLIEDRDKVVKVKYNEQRKALEYSESVKIGIAISIAINEEIRNAKDDTTMSNLYNAMRETYYYLARYLFEYFLPAMEFGIPPQNQFIAPRTMVLNKLAVQYSKFAYREDRPVMTVSMPQGTGKEQPLSSKILTPTGWITMGDVEVGTKVISASGKPCNVTGVFPKGVKDVYRVTFDDNTYVDCGLEHLWEVTDAISNTRQVKNLKSILTDYMKKGYSVRLVKPVENIYNTKSQRLEQLRKYMDLYGYIEKSYMKGIRFKILFVNKDEKIRNKVIDLVRSLGGKAIYVNNYLKKYIVEIETEFNPFTSKNPYYMIFESIKEKIQKNNGLSKMITNIEKVRQEECQCIMIDDPEHLYVTDGYTLTHNTEIGKRFLAWFIGSNPDKPCMFVSYSASIAKDKGYNGIDALVNDDYGNFKKIFPNIREIYRSAQDLVLDYTDDPNRKKPHSEYSLYCVGFDGSVTGRTRAHGILFCDDLVKDIEEASNKDIMDKKWIEFTGTLKKRMQGRCKLLLNGTIFSINDPLSRAIKYYEETAPERLIRIRIPGLNEKDESNFNYKYGYAITTEMFHEDRDLMDPVAFSCLIQQEPMERAGLLFFEKDFKKYNKSDYTRHDGYVRTVAACDVAWGGEDFMSMPIIDEYENGDCFLIDWYFINKADKTITRPEIVSRLKHHGVTRACFEANNGGDEYADNVRLDLEKDGYMECYVESKKAPTNQTKLDRILARQAEIRGSEASKYRLVIPTRESIKNDRMMNDALNQVFKFNQSPAKNVRKKQHEDAADSLSMIFTNVLGLNPHYGKAVSSISRDELGI